MAQLVANCPRCGTRNVAFNLQAYTEVAQRYDWQRIYEAFCVCSHCGRSTVFVLAEKGIPERNLIIHSGLLKLPSANSVVKVEDYVSLKNRASVPAPEHVPAAIKAAFDEGATCMAVDCPNGAGCMFRLCVDLATRSLLPPPTDEKGPNAAIRRNLGLRLPWLLDNKILPEDLRELSSCIREDGNDGAHAGTLKPEEAQDLLDFTTLLLERLYTEPERLRLAKQRRDERRKPPGPAT